MIKYDTALCVRINDHLKNTISEICNGTRINEADWVRASLADCAKKDAADLDQGKRPVSPPYLMVPISAMVST